MGFRLDVMVELVELPEGEWVDREALISDLVERVGIPDMGSKRTPSRHGSIGRRDRDVVARCLREADLRGDFIERDDGQVRLTSRARGQEYVRQWRARVLDAVVGGA